MKRQRVVLYNPRAVFYTMPLALVAVGSHLDPERYEVQIVDGRLEADPVAAVRAHLDGALCLGVTVLTGAPIADAVAVSRAAKAYRPDLPVVWGGWHPSMFGRECLKEPSVDVTVQAQGEITFHEICDRLAVGESVHDLDGCPGCVYRTADGEIRQNPPRPLADLNRLRPHDYRLLPVERYYDLKGRRQLDYISSQGCAFRCTFCADPFIYNRKWAGLAPERMGEEIGELWQRYRFEDLSFQDETYFTYVPRVEAVAGEILRRALPITWAATMRADQGDRLPEEVMATCRRSGLRRVLIGVESGSQEMIDRIKKDIKVEQVLRSAEKCRRHGVKGIFPFIVGFPGESDESVSASLALAKRLRAMSPEFETPIFYFKPYPGSPITDDAVRDGYVLPADLDEWSRFDFIGSAGPWVSREKHRLIERFKFYQRIAWNSGKPWAQPARALARWRLERDTYGWPVEKVVSDWLWPQPEMS
ncbi:MAG TPA: radical SAM protein [Thermoanaerobaculia bacterium]|nr:radical SAM protein [Thermoanaerobaculia bacterium]